jgi:hypothetical protein
LEVDRDYQWSTYYKYARLKAKKEEEDDGDFEVEPPVYKRRKVTPSSKLTPQTDSPHSGDPPEARSFEELSYQVLTRYKDVMLPIDYEMLRVVVRSGKPNYFMPRLNSPNMKYIAHCQTNFQATMACEKLDPHAKLLPMHLRLQAAIESSLTKQYGDLELKQYFKNLTTVLEQQSLEDIGLVTRPQICEVFFRLRKGYFFSYPPVCSLKMNVLLLKIGELRYVYESYLSHVAAVN